MFAVLALSFTAVNRPTPPPIAFTAGWESGDLTQGLWSLYSLPNANSAVISTDFARSGTHSVKFTLNYNDSSVGGSKRSEFYLRQSNALTATIRWYAWSEYLPAGYAYDVLPENHFQIHQLIVAGSPLVELQYTKNAVTLCQTFNPTGTKKIARFTPVGDIIRGQWVDWVLYYRYATDNTGLLILYRNGVEVANIPGANFNKYEYPAGSGIYIDEPNGYPKFGCYKWPWSQMPPPFNPAQRVLYIDDVMLGIEGHTAADFAHTADPAPPAPPEPQPTQYKGARQVRRN